MIKNIFLFSVIALGLTGCVCGPKVDNAPVGSLNLSRYLGVWYEIARFDHSFERGVESAEALYTQNADGTIKVVNSGIKNGKEKTAIGKGKTTGTPGLLRVSFFWSILCRLSCHEDRCRLQICACRERRCGLSLVAFAYKRDAGECKDRISCGGEASWIRYDKIDLGKTRKEVAFLMV